ncbi:MAG: hypothetical protein O3B03_07115 [Proteobacteria bacterium]|nr:hypothetical protein [Pseudomonadota bacterium]
MLEIILTNALSLLVGTFIGHFLALGRDRRKEVYAARTEFRNVFVEIQRLLKINPPKDPAHPPEGWQNTNKLVRKFYQKHHSAIIEFEPFVPWYGKRCFTRCWHNYCCYDKQSGCETFADYEPRSGEDEIAKRELALSRIVKLLKFARV